MKVVLSARVEGDIAHQFAYGIAAHGQQTAAQKFARVDRFLTRFLGSYPRAGRKLADAGLYETWIARTPFVIIYRIDDEAEVITVLALFHQAQDRGEFAPAG